MVGWPDTGVGNARSSSMLVAFQVLVILVTVLLKAESGEPAACHHARATASVGTYCPYSIAGDNRSDSRSRHSLAALAPAG